MLQLILGILGLVAAIWVIYDVFTNNKKIKKELKLVWTICAILFSIVTAIVYFFMYKYK
jgi:CDP-diglyceride synthetase